jgi:GAF domain-containing protein
MVHLAGVRGETPQAEEAMRSVFPMPLDDTSPNIRRAVLERGPVQIADVRQEPDYARAEDAQDKMGFLSIMSVPLLHDGRAIGTIGVARREPGLFPDAAVTLLQTFAHQAVIAIENVRLFNETQEALAQQKASAEVLTVISQSVSDTQPVFDKILDSCKHLFGGDELDVLLVDDQRQLQIAAYVGKAFDVVSKTFPAPVDITPAGRAIRERCVVHYPDVLHGADVPNVMRRMGQLVGYQSLAFAPMLWNDASTGYRRGPSASPRRSRSTCGRRSARRGPRSICAPSVFVGSSSRPVPARLASSCPDRRAPRP